MMGNSGAMRSLSSIRSCNSRVLKFCQVAPQSLEIAEDKRPRRYPRRISSADTWFQTQSKSPVFGM